MFRVEKDTIIRGISKDRLAEGPFMSFVCNTVAVRNIIEVLSWVRKGKVLKSPSPLADCCSQGQLCRSTELNDLYNVRWAPCSWSKMTANDTLSQEEENDLSSNICEQWTICNLQSALKGEAAGTRLGKRPSFPWVADPGKKRGEQHIPRLFPNSIWLLRRTNLFGILQLMK